MRIYQARTTSTRTCVNGSGRAARRRRLGENTRAVPRSALRAPRCRSTGMTTAISTVLVRKLRLGEVQRFAWCHTAEERAAPAGVFWARDASPLPPPGRKDGVRSELESPPPRHRGLRAQTDMAVVPGIGTDWGCRGRAGGRRGGKRQNSKLREGNQQSPGGPPPRLLSARPTPESCS